LLAVKAQQPRVRIKSCGACPERRPSLGAPRNKGCKETATRSSIGKCGVYTSSQQRQKFLYGDFIPILYFRTLSPLYLQIDLVMGMRVQPASNPKILE
jgi:hypothetical protein